MKSNLFRLFLGCALSLIACVCMANGQNVTGTITGEVTDPSGADIAGANVVALNLDTGVATSATSNGAGLFRIEFLPIGHYQVTVAANGFEKATIPPFSLEVQQTANFNVHLVVGSTSTNVTVSAESAILNTENPTIGTTFTANTIANLPLNGQDFSAVTLYMPGAVTTYGTSGPTSFERSTYNSDTPNFNGNRAQANNYTLEGIDMNETYNNLISYSPAPEALEEMKVVTADSPTDQGNVNGAAVELVLKSGTNQYHGSAYGFVQDYRFNANSYSNGQTSPVTPINSYSFAQFGGAIGGPIVHNKLFFFGDYLGSRWHKGGLGPASVIPDAMRNGNFSALLTASSPIQLYDPENNYAEYTNNENVPIVNPVAKFLFSNPKFYPDCGGDNPVTPAGGQCLTPEDGIAEDNYEAPNPSYKGNNQGDAKIEYDMRANDKLTGFYSISHAYDGSVPVLAIEFPGVNLYPTWLTGATWTHTFSPTLLNSARIGFTRTDWNQGFPVDSTGAFGTGGNAKVGITFPNQRFNGFSYQNIANGISGVGTPAYDGGIIDNTYSYIDTVTWQRGKHFLSFGAQALRYQNNYPTGNNDGYLGSLNYTGAFTSNPNSADGGGYGPADFVLDRVQSVGVTLGSVNVGQRQWRAAGFFQDSYKVTTNLTLIAGLRYEYDEPWIEENDKTGNVNLATGQIMYAVKIPAGAPPDAGICPTPACYQPNYRQWMPHVGFAYQFNEHAVVRGGYGANSFFEGNSYNQRLTAIAPFIQAVNIQVNSPAPGAVTTPRTAEEGFAGGTTSYSGSSYFSVYPQNIQPAYVQQWNLTVEYALTPSASLQVGYVGEQGQHIEDYGNVNAPLNNADPTSEPFYNNQYIGVNGVDTTYAPDPVGVGSNFLLITESRAMMNYNALQAVLRQRLTHGLEYTVNYTWGKAMTNSLGNYTLNVNGYSGEFQDYYNSAADYGPAGYDIKHDLSATAVYALPVGRGQQLLSNANRALDEAVGGWKLSTAIVGYSGFPETITGPNNNSNSISYVFRVNQYRPLKVVDRSNAHWFGTDPSATPCLTAGADNGTCAFGVPAPDAFGTESNGAVRGPGYFNTDLSAFKDFHTFREEIIGFRFDAFNAFNIVSYGNPDTGITDTNFGNVSLQGPRSQERHLQFSLHYDF
ncbi:MAG TPA: carboxypeptidase regulatory-like domain-containing protein [Terracidiphilus sp.]|nr:carboxypeptidase regulatory-like domain-containing protein [Terracidiphilus sp.]